MIHSAPKGAVRMLSLSLLVLLTFRETPGSPIKDSISIERDSVLVRDFQSYLPKGNADVLDPSGHIIQVLLDRQDKGEYDSYLITVLYRGQPSRKHRISTWQEGVHIDFLDTGKPSARVTRIRGGIVEASDLRELFYTDVEGRVRHMARLVLFTGTRPELKVRHTLDRSLIHFKVPKP